MDKDIISYAELYEAYIDCRKNKRWTENAFNFESNDTVNLQILLKELNDMTYQIGKSICFIVTKPKLREVFAADFRDRIVHHLVIRRLMSYLEQYGFIYDSYSCREGKGTLFGVHQIYYKTRECSEDYTKQCYYLKCDLQGFFMSIDKRIIFAKLKKFIDEHHIFNEKEYPIFMDIIHKIVFHCPQYNCIKRSSKSLWEQLPKNKSLFFCDEYHGIPIGNLSSQIFANFLLYTFDVKMCKTFNNFYGRYVDDFIAITTEEDAVKKYVPKIKTYLLEKLGVTLHPNKVSFQPYQNGVNFIGGTIKKQRIYTGNRTVRYMFSCLKRNFDKFFHFDKNENIIQHKNIDFKDLQKFQSSINSYLGFIVHYMTYRIREKFFNNKRYKAFSKYFDVEDGLTSISIKEEYKTNKTYYILDETKLGISADESFYTNLKLIYKSFLIKYKLTGKNKESKMIFTQDLLESIGKLYNDNQFCQDFSKQFSIFLSYITSHNCSQEFEIITPLILINIVGEIENIHNLKYSRLETVINNFIMNNKNKNINYSRLGIKAERGYSRFEMYCALELANFLYDNQEYFFSD